MPGIVLIGFMGAGKTSVARVLSQRLGVVAVDTDTLIEALAGQTIAQIFATEGEKGFRAREADAVAAAAASAAHSGSVIACGGGAVLSIPNLKALQEAGPIVYLRATAKTLIARLGDGIGRPLLAGNPSVTVPLLLAERGPAYRAVADVVVDTDDRTPDDIASEIERLVARRIPGTTV